MLDLLTFLWQSAFFSREQSAGVSSVSTEESPVRIQRESSSSRDAVLSWNWCGTDFIILTHIKCIYCLSDFSYLAQYSVLLLSQALHVGNNFQSFILWGKDPPINNPLSPLKKTIWQTGRRLGADWAQSGRRVGTVSHLRSSHSRLELVIDHKVFY